MARTVAIGIQDFENILANNYFYIDKTSFIKEWWESGDSVTLITRPRRFGKTLNMSMLDYFFSVNHAGRGDLFEGLEIWEEQKYRELQGTYPVISLSFANVKEKTYEKTIGRIYQIISELYDKIDKDHNANAKMKNMDFSRYPFNADDEYHFYIENCGNEVVDLEMFVEVFKKIDYNLNCIAGYYEEMATYVPDYD